MPDSQASSSSEEILFGKTSAKVKNNDIDSEELEQLEKMVADLSDNDEQESTFKKVIYETMFGPDYKP